MTRIHLDGSPARPQQRPRPPAAEADLDDPTSLVEEDLLVEDVSIDGMCGVY